MSADVLKIIEGAAVFYDDLKVGDRFVTSGRTVTEVDIVNFAGLSADWNALHTNAEFAAGTPHGKRIAHGLLVLAIVSGLCTRLPVMKFMEKAILGLANLQCRWLRPAFIGDTLHVVMEVAAKEPGKKPGQGSVVFKRSALNQTGEAAMESEWKIVMAMRA